MNLGVIGANLVVSVKSFYREKSAVFFRLAFPIILILVFGTIFMDKDTMSFDLDVQDLDGTQGSKEFLKALETAGKFQITPIAPAIDAEQYAKDNKLNLVVIIPKGYEQSLSDRVAFDDPEMSVDVTMVYDPSSSSVSTKMQVLGAVIAGVNQEISGTAPFIQSAAKSILGQEFKFIEFFVPGIIAMAVMTSSLFGAVNVNAELRQKGVIRKLSTTPITHTEWILSNIFYQFLLAVLSTTAILVVSYAVFNVKLRTNAWLPLFVVLDVFAFVGLGMMLTRVAKEAESAAAAANVFMFPMMFLSGTFFPVDMMPGFLQKFARLLPLYYVNEGLRASMVSGDNMAALTCAWVIGVFAAVVFVLGIVTTKWEDGA